MRKSTPARAALASMSGHNIAAMIPGRDCGMGRLHPVNAGYYHAGAVSGSTGILPVPGGIGHGQDARATIELNQYRREG
jgi:hypothetical protein